MRIRMRLVLAVVSAMTLVSSSALAADGISSSRRRRNRDKEPSRYYILQVLVGPGEVEFKVVGNIDYRDKLKEFKEEYEESLREWGKARVAAKRAKEDFEEPRPAGPRMMKKWAKSFKEEEDATEYAEKLQEKWDEAMAKRRAKKGEKEGDFLDDDDDGDKDRKHKKDEDKDNKKGKDKDKDKEKKE